MSARDAAQGGSAAVTIITCRAPCSSSFEVALHDPLFTCRRGTSLSPRTFAMLQGDGSGLLLSDTHGEYRAAWEFATARAVEGSLWVFEQGRPWSSPFCWRIDDAHWALADAKLPLHATEKGGSDGPTFGWCRLGECRVAPGRHRLEVMIRERSNDGPLRVWFDRFVLADNGGTPGQGPPYHMEREQVTPNTVWLWDHHAPGRWVDDFRPRLDPYLVDTSGDSGVVLVVPGGGYVGRAPHEQHPVALKFNELGINALVLQYRVSPHRWPLPQMDGARAVRVVRRNARQWGISPNKIAVCGFSAGGHIAAMLGVHGDNPLFDGGSDLSSISCIPNALVLSYALLDCDWRLAVLFGEEYSAADAAMADATAQVHAHTPPTFLWHTAQDTGVPAVSNTLPFAMALARYGVPYELHVYPHGEHGLGVGTTPPVSGWTGECCRWLRGMGW